MRFILCYLLIGMIASTTYSQSALSIHVVNLAGEAVSGATVELLPLNIENWTNDEGYVVFESLQHGNYQIQVRNASSVEKRQVVLDGNKEIKIVLKWTLNLDEIVLNAVRKGNINNPSTTTINRESMATQTMETDLPYTLKFTPSMVVTSDAGAGVGYTSMRIRGTDQSRINVTINGIPLNEGESQQVYWVDLPDVASSVNSLQIQRGVGSSTYGAASFGASVNLNTHQLQERASTDISGLIGSFNSKKASAQFNTGRIGKGFYLNGRLSTIESDGYIDRAKSNLNSYHLSAAQLLGKTLIRFNLLSGHERTYQAWYGIDQETLDTDRKYNPAGTERVEGPYQDQVDDYSQRHHQLHFNHSFNTKLNGALAFHYTKGKGFYEEYKADQTLANYNIDDVIIGSETISSSDLVRRRWLDNDFYGFVSNINYDLKDNWNIVLGGGFNRYDGHHFGEIIWAKYAANSQNDFRYYDNDAKKTDGNVFLKSSHELNKNILFVADLQFRNVRHEFFGPDNNGTFLDQKETLNFINPKMSFNYISDDGKIMAHVFSGIAHKEPNRSDFTESTPTSRPKYERLWDNEFGLIFSPKKNLELSSNIYFMVYKDQLALTGELNDVGEYARVNVDNSYRAGIELAAAYKINNYLSTSASLTLSQNRIKSFDEFLDDYDVDFNYLGQVKNELKNTDISFSPPSVAHMNLTGKIIQNKKMDLTMAVDLKHVGSQFVDNSSDGANKLDAYQYVDLGLYFTPIKSDRFQLETKIKVNNILDQLYVNNAWSYKYNFDGTTALSKGFFPQAGRHFALAINLHF